MLIEGKSNALLRMQSDTIHKFLIMGIIAGVSLTTFLFGYTNQDIREIRVDVKDTNVKVTDNGEKLAYIKGKIDSYWPPEEAISIDSKQ